MPVWATGLLSWAGKFIWEMIFPPKKPVVEENALIRAGRNEVERDNAISAVNEMQVAQRAAQDQRDRLAADPHRLRDETGVADAKRPWNPGQD